MICPRFSISTIVGALLLLLPILASAGTQTTAEAASALAKANVKDFFSPNKGDGDNGVDHGTYNNNVKKCASCHRFDGIGGLSAGGGTARLLLDYPPDVQSEILDFLFMPNFGASLHHLKVEIGGDSWSTDGSESSHMHSQNDLNFHRGYEWWLLQEAKKRNPDILTYGLSWAFPGWISEDKKNPFLHMDRITNYTVNWVRGAKDVHGIDIDYLGVWNEAGQNREYLLALRKVLNENGFHNVKLVSNDGQAKDLCPSLVNDTASLEAFDVLGFHYPSDYDPVWPICNSLNKPIWSSEESSSYNDLNGAACWARVISSHYVLSNITSNIIWNLFSSCYHGTNWYNSGLFAAVQPWSGYYEYESMPVVWATAHYTQFIQPGWQYLPVGQGSGELSQGGYYTTLVSPDEKYFTVVVVKISRDHAPCTRPGLPDWDTEDEIFHLTINLPGDACINNIDGEEDGSTNTMQTWYSNFEQEDTILFEKQNNLHHRVVTISSSSSSKEGSCSYEISLNVTVGSIFTVTNQMKVGKKGQAKVRHDSDPRFPLPYYDDFTAYECDNCYSRYLTDQMGAFEIQFVADDNNHHDDDASHQQQKKKRALVQMAPERPVGWFSSGSRGPNTLIGMTEWEDIGVEASFRLPDPESAACVATRTDQLWGKGVSLCVNTTNWYLLYGGPQLSGIHPSSDIIESGKNTPALVPNKWYNMSLVTQGHQVEGSIQESVVTSKDTTIRVGDSGFVTLGASAFVAVQFGQMHIKAVGPSWSIAAQSSELMNESTAASWTLQLGLCTPNGLTTNGERFDVTANWQIKHLASGKCVTVKEEEDNSRLEKQDGKDDTTTATKLILEECIHDHPPQQFRNQYTKLRNGDMIRLTNGDWKGTGGGGGDLCANKDGRVSLLLTNDNRSSSVCTNQDDSFSSWSLYPNTGQLRTSFGYDPKNGGRAHCLQAVQQPGDATGELEDNEETTPISSH